MSKLLFIIDGQKVDIDKSIDFTRIYRGLETTDTKKNNYSLTVKFPFTYRNDLIFKRTNSLSYKSDFPYETHTCDVTSSSGVILISKANVKLLSTTDSYECALTWDDFDFVGSIINNPTKLGVFLKDFPFVEWNYNDVATYDEDSYTTLKANTYGYCRYTHFYGSDENQHFNTYAHPLVNFNYLLGLIFAEYGFNLDVPTVKNDFLQKLIIRPNKELDICTNNIFEAQVHYTTAYTSYINALQLDYRRSADLSPLSPTFGRNSYYFKSFMSNYEGDDATNIDDGYGMLPQTKRFKAYANTFNNQLVVTDYVVTTGSTPDLVRYRNGVFTLIHSITGNGTYTFDAQDGDWFYFKIIVAGDQFFNCTITTAIDETLTTPNELHFPSLYHIPTNIDLTVGEFVREALDLTCSQLIYDVNSDTYYFKDILNENSTAYDITGKITSIKEITYDTKYVYSKLAQENFFNYLTKLPIDADYSVLASDTRLIPEKTFIDSKFSTSSTQIGGYYDGFCIAQEHNYVAGDEFVLFVEQPLHLLWNDSVNSKIFFSSDLFMGNIYSLFWENYFIDLLSLVLSGTVRLLKVNTEISDIEFKRINLKGSVYIKTYGKYYGIIEVAKNGDFAEFFLLELY
jgi:hypothetical protein